MARWSIVLAFLALLAFPVAAPAQVATAPSDQRTVSASGVARVAVKEPRKLTEATIQAAVDAADRAAEAKAIRVASVRAANYAANTGVTLGPLLTVDEGDFGIFGSLLALEENEEGGFAPFCERRERRVGPRRRLVTRTVCTVPEPRTAIVRLTYAIAPV